MLMGDGRIPSKIMIVGEAFCETDERAGTPFTSRGGEELNRMLHEAGIMRSECYMTNVVNARPPMNNIDAWIPVRKKDVQAGMVSLNGRMVAPQVVAGYNRLLKEIELVQPNVIVALGNTALWALSGATGVLKWRGSQLLTRIPGAHQYKLIPSIHPLMVLRQWEFRALCVNDLKRVAKEQNTPAYANAPAWNFSVRPSYYAVMDRLNELVNRLDSGEVLWIDFDLETRAGHIACAGISWTEVDALCIPFMCTEDLEGYWPPHEEGEIVHRLYTLLTHLNVKVRWQNGLYDAQYTYRHWHFVPRGVQDTMISHHTVFAGLPKRLDFQASMYCDHYVYWKDDGKTWTHDIGEDQLWAYNCVDCVRTREVGEVELANIKQLGLQEVEDFQQQLFWPVLRAMQLGVRMDEKVRGQFALELQDEMTKREDFFADVLGHPLNPRSSPQMQKLFYTDLGIPPVMKKAAKGMPARPTCDDDALEVIAAREPLARPLIKAIQEYRSLGVFLSTFVLAKLDIDRRMRCSYNICGTETYRFNSSKNAFDSGTNLQNIPKGKDGGDGLSLPNVRKLFLPDPGYTFFDMDLDRADLQVVVWEADEPELKEALRHGVDMHLLNALTLAGRELPDLSELVEGHERFDYWRTTFKKERQLAKSFIHGTNYGGGARTMAVAAGVTVHQADRFQKIYFGKYPGIKRWHERTEAQLTSQRYVSNAFGYRRYYFDRTDGLLPEALAWVPQSTVACVINRAWVNIYKNIPEVMVLLQVHDSLAGQFPTHLKEPLLRRMREESRIVIPYPDPLIIPTGIKVSDKSWGDCE